MSRIVLLAVAVGVTFSAVAEARGFRAGVSVGGSTATQSYDFSSGDVEFDRENLVRPAIGGYGELSFARISLGLDAMYVQKGLKDEILVTGTGPEVLGTRTIEGVMRYLSVPATVSFDFQVQSVSPYVFVGPSLEILLSYDKDSLFSEVFENMDTVVLGLHVGAGVRWRRLGASIRYFTDLSNSYTPPAGFALESVKNHGWLGLVSFAILQ